MDAPCATAKARKILSVFWANSTFTRMSVVRSAYDSPVFSKVFSALKVSIEARSWKMARTVLVLSLSNSPPDNPMALCSSRKVSMRSSVSSPSSPNLVLKWKEKRVEEFGRFANPRLVVFEG